MKVLSPSALEQIYAHADRSYPEECCGFVFADGSVYLGSNIQNELHSKNPDMYSRSAANGYTFSVADTLMMNKAFRSDNPMVVIYHSHPDVGAYFSDEDQDKALFMGEPIYPVSYLVVDVRQGKTQGSKLFAWDGKHFAQKPFNDLQTELCMNAVSFPDILVRVADSGLGLSARSGTRTGLGLPVIGRVSNGVTVASDAAGTTVSMRFALGNPAPRPRLDRFSASRRPLIGIG